MDEKCKRIKDIHEMNEESISTKEAKNLGCAGSKMYEFKCQAKGEITCVS